MNLFLVFFNHSGTQDHFAPFFRLYGTRPKPTRSKIRIFFNSRILVNRDFSASDIVSIRFARMKVDVDVKPWEGRGFEL